MQRLVYILYQIDEARRYIQAGRFEQLRLALLLLDNAVEIQLDRRIREELGHEDFKHETRRRLLQILPVERSKNLDELPGPQPLTRAERYRLSRFFDEKLKYLSERHRIIDARLVRPLSYLHGYRNEAYHEGRARRETFKTAAVILLEANCQLLLTVFRVSTYASDEDYSWLTERFGIQWRDLFMSNETLKGIVDSLRSDVVPTRETVIATLQEHLTSRIEELYDALDFIHENTCIGARAEALQASQFLAAVDRGNADPRIAPFNYKAAWSLESIEALRERISQLNAAPTRLDAFQLFSEIAEALEPIFSFGYALFLSTLPHMTRHGWRALRFDETLLGERATSGSVDSAPN